MKAIKVSLCPDRSIPLVPKDIKERVRAGEKVSIELMHGTSGFVKNALRHGVAGLWIDGVRILTQEELGRSTSGPYVSRRVWNKTSTGGQNTRGTVSKGRYPKNVIHDSSEEVLAEFAKAGVRKSGGEAGKRVHRKSTCYGKYNAIDYPKETSRGPDTGSAARYFLTCPSDPCLTCNGTKLCEVELSFEEFMNNPYEPLPEYKACPDCVICPHCFDLGVEPPEQDMTGDDWETYAKEHPCPECRVEEPVRFQYCAKASRKERVRGLDEMEKTVGHVAYGDSEGTLEHVSNKGKPRVSTHPTQKPLSLTRFLTRISRTPTGGIVLDPFLGSGTTSLAAFLEDRASIGIEQNLEYCEIAANRLAHEQSLDPTEGERGTNNEI